MPHAMGEASTVSARFGLFLGKMPSLILHFAFVESHCSG